jgi:uncharacterized protein
MTQPGEAGDPLIDALLDPARYPDNVDTVELVQTHISWVLLAGDYAYKIKKPVKLPFVDFSSAEARRRFCEDELALNRRLAPELYLEVLTIGGSREDPKLGDEPAIEHAVRMKRFPAQARLDRRLARSGPDAAAIRALAELLAGFHAGLAPVTADADREAARLRAAALENIDELEPRAGSDREREALGALRAWTEAESDRLAERLRARRAAGAVRECHGDLHLENLVELDDRIVPFDALEFDRELRTIDVLNETAFLTMDLLAHGHSDAAFTFLNRYLEVGGDYDGLDLLRYFLVYRALVRAKVRALGQQQGARLDSGNDGPGPYFRLAVALLDTGAPLLVITHGLSGSGKTTATEALIAQLPALRLRSDLERKRLHGLAADTRSGSAVGGGLYDESATATTYRRLEQCAARGLAGGFNIIVDATFLERERRDDFRRLAGVAGAGFAIVDFRAPESVLRERVSKRSRERSDASEADIDVLNHQLAHAEPLTDEERELTVAVDTTATSDPEEIAAALRDQSDRSDSASSPSAR